MRTIDKKQNIITTKDTVGWTEALQMMPAGSTWQLVIPPELAYGERGAGGRILPNSALVFDVELISIADTE
ncbi:FKBP-type peptidyl-prolyl cis-trans isomerase [Pseudomonadales bacterium]|nr:FKBP-type peptidyl-prolyl cis-trans isomerase [Pseudomonadales bacterium]